MQYFKPSFSVRESNVFIQFPDDVPRVIITNAPTESITVESG